jgi:hypothetical protein
LWGIAHYGIQYTPMKTPPPHTDKPIATDAKARHAKPAGKPYKVFFEKGMFLLVNQNGSKYWRWRYCIDGREKFIALGVYAPATNDGRGRVSKGLVSLAEARSARDEAIELLQRKGKDPASERKTTKEALRTTYENAHQ